MKRMLLPFILISATACSSEPTEPTIEATVRLVRQPARRIGIEVSQLARPVAAMQLSLSIAGGDSTGSFEDLKAPDTVALDSVRIGAVGANRAIAFVGDSRGVALPGIGEVASFVVQGGSGGTLTIDEVVLSDEAGVTLSARLGPDVILP